MSSPLQALSFQIETPSGRVVHVDASRLAMALHHQWQKADHAPLPIPARVGRQDSGPVPSDLYAYLQMNTSELFDYVWLLNYSELLSLEAPKAAPQVTPDKPGTGDYADGLIWETIRERAKDDPHGNPFVFRLVPYNQPEDEARLDAATASDLLGILTGIHRDIASTDSSVVAQAHTRLLGLQQALAKLANQKPAPDTVESDGWGHAKDATTVEALLREGDAMFAGTDKHEQVFRDMDDHQRFTLLWRAIADLKADHAAGAKAAKLHTEQIGALETRATQLQAAYDGLVKPFKRLYRHAKSDYFAQAYGARASAQDDPIRRVMERAAREFDRSGEVFNLAQFEKAFKVLFGHGHDLSSTTLRIFLASRKDVIQLHGGNHYQILG